MVQLILVKYLKEYEMKDEEAIESMRGKVCEGYSIEACISMFLF